MVVVFVHPFLDIACNPDVKSSGFAGHYIDIVVFHGAILARMTC